MTTNKIKNDGDDPLIMVGMKVMFIDRDGWYVGEVLRFEGERILIQRQGRNVPRVWIHEGDVRPLPGSAPKSGFLGPDG